MHVIITANVLPSLPRFYSAHRQEKYGIPRGVLSRRCLSHNFFS